MVEVKLQVFAPSEDISSSIKSPSLGISKWTRNQIFVIKYIVQMIKYVFSTIHKIPSLPRPEWRGSLGSNKMSLGRESKVVWASEVEGTAKVNT